MKVLVVDDSAVYRKIISDIVREIPELELVGTAANGKMALSMIEIKRPELVLLDVNMPVMDGMETLREIKRRYPLTSVIMISGADRESAHITLQALQEGALEFIPKPSTKSFTESKAEILKALTNAIHAHRHTSSMKLKPIKLPRDGQRARPSISAAHRTVPGEIPKRVGIVAIGVSTGGPKALAEVLPALPREFPVPVVIVQHIPPTFSSSLAEYLDKKSKVKVVEGAEGMELSAGTVYIAPGGRHMVVRCSVSKCIIGLTDSPPVNNCKPSVDVLFRSLVTFPNGGIITVMLTGMGNDGANGVEALTRRKKSYNIVQDAATCVVYGMPRVVVEKGLAHEILPIEAIAPRLIEIVMGRK